MFKHFKTWFLALLVALSFNQSVLAQFRGSDRGGDRDDWRRRFEEMRSRGDWGRGGDDRSRWGGGSPWGGGFPGSDRGRDRDDNDDRGRDRGRDGDRDRDDRSRYGDRGRDTAPRIQPFVPKPHTPIGMELPGNYVAGDANADGQIDLVEWRQWKPQEIASFMTMDTNKDGFLTARELVIAQSNPPETSAASSGTYQASTPNPTPTPSGPDADGNPVAGEKPSAAEARYVFVQLDKNLNGQLEDHEWQSSKAIRAGFEDQGIKLTLPVDQAAFLDRYPAQRIVPQKRLPG